MKLIHPKLLWNMNLIIIVEKKLHLAWQYNKDKQRLRVWGVFGPRGGPTLIPPLHGTWGLQSALDQHQALKFKSFAKQNLQTKNN